MHKGGEETPIHPRQGIWTDSTGQSLPRWKRTDASPLRSWAKRSGSPNRRAGRGSGASRKGVSFRAILRASRSEEHTYELQSLMRISYAVFCLIKTPKTRKNTEEHTT